jgi:tetratricopeptide (TPR) repeat protein
MLRRIGFTLLLMVSMGGFVGAQDNAERFLEIRGISELDMEPLSRATANLYEGSTRIKSIQTGTDGSFSFRLEMNKQYTLEVEKDGLVSKRISFNTTMPDEEKGSWMNEFSIGLVRKCDGVDYSVLKEPVDKVSFDPKRREYVSDKEYVARMRSRIEGMMIKNDQCLLSKYEDAVKKGEQLMAQQQYQEAIASFQEASAVFPTETYPAKRIAEINAQVDRQQNMSIAYKKVIEEADALAAQQQYTAAIQKYKSAAKLNPQDAYPGQKVAEIESVLARQLAAKQAEQTTEDRYNQALAKASVAYTRKDYAVARQYYQEALQIKPNESVPQVRMQEIETILAKKASEEAARVAEITAKASFEQEYKNLVLMADEQFKSKKYEEARQTYAKAMTMKPSDPHPAQRIKTIDNAVAAEQASRQKSQEEEYNAILVAANKALAQEQFAQARAHYEKALTLKPGDAAASNKLAEVDRREEEAIQLKARDEQFKKAIATADALHQGKELAKAKEAYQMALSIKPGDSYAVSRINAIDNTLAAEQAARMKSTEEGYKAAIGAAQTAITQKSYIQAKEFLHKALVIKPGDAFAMARSAEVDRLLEEQKMRKAQEEMLAAQYKAIIAAADKAFSSLDYVAAKTAYQQALQISPGDPYALQRISAIDDIVAATLAKQQKQVEDSYKLAMDKGTTALVAKDYQAARSAFREAVTIKPSDVSAQTKLTETELLIRQNEEKQAADQARRKKYDTTVQSADQYLARKDYANAVANFEEALDLIPGESYPQQKIVEIKAILAEREREIAEKQSLENAYNLSLANADKYYKAKDYSQARDEYARALRLKPDEAFPKSKVAEMDNLIMLRQKEQQDAKARADAYTAAMNEGNSLFEKKDYLTARSHYQEALKVMPGDALASEQVKKIDFLLAESEKLKEAEAARKASYAALIKSADNSFDAGSYLSAREDYKQALAIEPKSTYAKQRMAQIDEINRVLAQSSAKKSTPVSSAKTQVAAAIPMGELNFKNESERQKYLAELMQKYPAGITLEKYKEKYKEIYRYIIIRDNLAQEFRMIQFTTYNGSQYSVNGKPITQQYFLSQTKPRQGESFKEITMQ